MNKDNKNTDLETKNESKHVLYCMLCFRFNEAQRFAYMRSGTCIMLN